MTLRVKYDAGMKKWCVEYLSSSWYVCNDYYQDKDTFAAFNTKEEAEAFMNWKYEKYNAPEPKSTYVLSVPEDYYVNGAYNGD